MQALISGLTAIFSFLVGCKGPQTSRAHFELTQLSVCPFEQLRTLVPWNLLYFVNKTWMWSESASCID